MTVSSRIRRAARVAMVLGVLGAALGASPAMAARDRTPPTKPTNLRVTSLTAHRATLAWNPSTDNSGTFSYRLWVSYGFTHTVPQSETSFSLGLVPANTYSFYVYAVDGSGNASARSNTLTVTTPADTTAPTVPVATLAGVNPTEAHITWSASTDDGPYVRYQVYVDGVPDVDAGQELFAVVHGLSPETTYDITVRARDLYDPPNVSAPSNVLAVTTPAVSEADPEPPTVPTDFIGWDISSNGEVELSWTESFDNQSAQADLRYLIYMNGVHEDTAAGDHRLIYAVQGQDNVFDLVAVDAAGNESAPASFTLFVP